MVTGRIERSRQQQAMKGPCYRVAIIYSAFHEAGKEVGPKPAAVTGVEHRRERPRRCKLHNALAPAFLTQFPIRLEPHGRPPKIPPFAGHGKPEVGLHKRGVSVCEGDGVGAYIRRQTMLLALYDVDAARKVALLHTPRSLSLERSSP